MFMIAYMDGFASWPNCALLSIFSLYCLALTQDQSVENLDVLEIFAGVGVRLACKELESVRCD